MSRYRENYRGVPDGEFELMPEGNYPVKVVNATVSPSKSSGKDTWCLELEVTGLRYAGRKFWLYHGMSEEARPMRKGTMTALGLNPEDDNDLIDDVMGRKALAVVYHDTYNGQKREKVKRLRSMKKSEESVDEFSSGEVQGSDSGDGIPF
jgi:hypothetical protein